MGIRREIPLHRIVEMHYDNTRWTSNITEIVNDPFYQAVIGIGPRAIPFLLRELQNKRGWWFHALYELTGVNPVDEKDAGNVPRMTDAWLEWGKREGYIGEENET